MPSKSKDKLLNEIADFTLEEVFRAYIAALRKDDDELCNSILMNLPKETRVKLRRLTRLFMQKLYVTDGYLLTKASRAVTFYNCFIHNLISPGDVQEFTAYEQKQFLECEDIYKNSIQKIDDQAAGMLQLEEFAETEKMVEFYDYWLTQFLSRAYREGKYKPDIIERGDEKN